MSSARVQGAQPLAGVGSCKPPALGLIGAVPEGACWDCCLPGWASPFGMAPANFADTAHSNARGSPLEPAVELQSSSRDEGVAKEPQMAFKKRVDVKARESQGKWSLPPPPFGWWGAAREAPHRALTRGSVVETLQPGRHCCSASSLFPPFHCSFLLPWPPASPPQPQSSLKISRQILLNREISSGCFPALPRLSLPSPFLACWVLCFSCYK